MRSQLPTIVSIVALLVACSGSSNTGIDDGSKPASDAGPTPSGSATTDPPTQPVDNDAGPTQPGVPFDPTKDGPFEIDEKDATVKVAATTDSVAIHAAFPKTGTAHPVVVFGHGFQLAPSLYYGYLKRLASFGYVALTVDFPAEITGPNNPNEATDLLAGIDWAKANLKDVDDTKVGATGHSLGGKIALLAASKDARVKASIVLDPVDGGQGGCDAPNCVLVADLLPTMNKPTGFLGETTDASGGIAGNSCAPAAQNFTTFYAKATSPSFQVTVTGANHMSFLDDANNCGFACGFCNAATASNADVNGMAKAYVVAFYERHLRGNTAYDTYLTGAVAQTRYVSAQKATIASK